MTGGGLFGCDGVPLASLRAEGKAMISALATDCAAVENVELTVLRDARCADLPLPRCRVVDVHSASDERACLEQLAREMDAGMLIAPEIGQALAERVRWIEGVGGRLLSPNLKFVTLASNKIRTSQQLRKGGIQVPESGQLDVDARGFVDLPRDFPYPAIIKRIDGAGSVGMQFHSEPARCHLDPHAPWMIERFCPGITASVALISAPNVCLPLPPFLQKLDPETFQYLGGSRLMGDPLGGRATNLATEAIAILGPPTGYVGVDLVLGEDPSGKSDYVIEINPRITTSYIGHRALANDNVAEAIISIAYGGHGSLSFRDGSIQFAVDGHID